MNVFDLNRHLISDYSSYIRSFIQIRDKRIDEHVQNSLEEGLLWPEPLIQLNPSFEPGQWIEQLVSSEILHPECSRIFRINKSQQETGQSLRLHKHQVDAIKAAMDKISTPKPAVFFDVGGIRGIGDTCRQDKPPRTPCGPSD